MVEVIYSAQLMEEVITLEIQEREKKGDLELIEEYHGLTDPLYELPFEDREEAFEKAHSKIFSKLPSKKIIPEILEEFSIVKRSVGTLEVEKGYTEEADISRRCAEDGLTIARFTVRPQLFLNPPLLQKTLRHEFMHLTDMFDETFGYERKPFASSPVKEAVIRQRYRALWDIFIDTRLERNGKETPVTKSERYKEFSLLYRKIAPVHREKIFEQLWGMKEMNHGVLFELAANPQKLLHTIGEEVDGDESGQEKLILPGSSCPLCQFPTYKPIENLSPLVVDAIKRDFPDWEDGWACERCFDLYSFRLKTSAPAF